MVIEKRKKYICLLMAIILFFLGMSVDILDTDSFFAYESGYTTVTNENLQETNVGIINPAICTLNMIKGGYTSLYGMTNGGVIRYQNKVYFSAFFLTAYLLYRSIYQSSESKEDGQLFLCRSVIVDYIHQKDSGE